MMNTVVLALCCALVACSSSSDDGDGRTKVNQANPCVTPGATYLQMTNKIDGTCPDVPDQVINISNDGTLANEISCDKVEQDGCRAHNTGCVTKSGKCNASATFSTTFADDGSSASGLLTMTVECEDGSGCVGTYETSMERQ
jgi:hypothetical protein